MIYVGSDHGGYEMKKVIVDYLGEKATDCGTFSKESCDYPDIAKEVCAKIGDGDIGILVCGTGIGMCITANKFKGIRAAVVNDAYSAKMAREHNNCNVLCLGQRVIGIGLAMELVEHFLNAKFLGDRHQRRIDKIEKI